MSASAEPWKVVPSATARRALRRVPDKAAAAIVEFIDGPLRENPQRLGKELRGEMTGLRSARRGEYRVIYRLPEQDRLIEVIFVSSSSGCLPRLTAIVPGMSESATPWWRDAVMYQIYLRSFADGTGDGIGDLPGVRARLPYLRDLGVDGLWLTPWYPSPMKDGGYDVADYTDIEPLFGTLDDARALLDDAHALGLKVIVDFVANHTSDEHPWFTAALAAAPGSDERARYHFRDGRGEHGEQPPNDWISAFGGPAWTRVTEPDGTPGQWYLHLFAPAQPDLNWDHPGVRADLADMLRFWFDFGLDGLRMDAASGLAKEPGLPDFGFLADDLFMPVTWEGAPLWDVEGVHDILREWRAIADSYPGDRLLRRRGRGQRGGAAGPLHAARTSCTPPSTSTS